MSEQNMNEFTEMARSILRYLHLSFPHPADIGAGSLSLPFTGGGSWEDGEWVPAETTREEKLFNSTIQWLHQTGFIYGRVRDDQSIAGAVLTEKGLESQDYRLSLRQID